MARPYLGLHKWHKGCLTPLLALLALLANICKAQAQLPPGYTLNPLPHTVELDLVFPRSNGTYQRTYPFPLVFSFQGLHEAWRHHVQLAWTLRPARSDDPAVAEAEPVVMELGGFPDDLPQELRGDAFSVGWTNGEAPEGVGDTFFYVVGASDVLNMSAAVGGDNGDRRRREWVVAYDFGYYYNCSLEENDGRPGSGIRDRVDESYIAQGKVHFFLDDEEGVDPLEALVDITGKDTCPEGLAAIRMKESLTFAEEKKQVKMRLPNGELPPCAVLEEDTEALSPAPEPCGARPPADLPSVVQSLMLRTARCTTGSWPAKTLVSSCGHNVSGQDDESVAAFSGFPLPAIMLGGLVGLTSLWIMVWVQK